MQCFSFCGETPQSLSVRPENGCMRKNVQNASSAAFYYSLKENDGGPALLDKHRAANGGALAARRTNLPAHFPLMT